MLAHIIDHLRHSSTRSKRYWNRRFARDRAGWTASGDRRFSEEVNRESAGELLELLRSSLQHHAAPPAGRQLLDAGCGQGHFTDMASDLGFEVLGVDISDVAVQRARDCYPGLRFEVGDLAALDLNGRFDVILSVNVLVAIAAQSAWQQTLAAFERHLARDGIIMILQTVGHPADAGTVPDHIRYRSLEDYEQAWQRMGLCIRHHQAVWLEAEQREKHLMVVGRIGSEEPASGSARD